MTCWVACTKTISHICQNRGATEIVCLVCLLVLPYAKMAGFLLRRNAYDSPAVFAQSWVPEAAASRYITFVNPTSDNFWEPQRHRNWRRLPQHTREHMSAARLKQASQTKQILLTNSTLNIMLCILNDGLPSWAHTRLICTTDLLQSIILRASAGDHMRYSGLYDCSKTEACVSCTACCYILLYMPGQASHGWAWAYQRKTRKDCTFLHQFQWETRWDTAVPRGTYKKKDGPTALPHFHGIWDYHLRHSGLRDCSRTEICACSSHDALCFVFGILQIWSSPPIHEKCNFCHSQKTLRYAPEAVEPDKSCQSNFWKMENLFDITAEGIDI